MSLLILIPIRGIKSSMTRIRGKISADIVSTHVSNLFFNTLRLATKVGRVITLTSDIELKEKLESQNYQVVYDDGSSLNKAILSIIKKYEFTKLMILMPDLPGLNPNSIYKIQALMSVATNFIIPSFDRGTNVALISSEFAKKLPEMLYGKESSLKFREIAENHNLPLSIFRLKECSRDLDTVDDWLFWGL